MRPRSMILFERLGIVKIVLGAIVGVFVFAHFADFVAPNGAPPLIRQLMPLFAGGSILLGILISVLILYFVARRGSEVAKWIFVVLFALGAIALIRSLTGPGLALHWTHGISGLQVLIEIVMMWLLFQPESRTWFSRRGRRSMEYSDDFR